MIRAIVGVLAAAWAWQASVQPGRDLAAGTTLIYESGGGRQVWVVDSTKRDSVGWCGRVFLRRDAAAAEERFDCVEDGFLRRRSPTTGAWRRIRPIRPGLELTIPSAGGSQAIYRVGGAAVDTIGGRAIGVVETVVTTQDSSGVARRRLRERYAVTLTTATWGIFEVADSTAPSGWRTQQEFRLVAIEPR